MNTINGITNIIENRAKGQNILPVDDTCTITRMMQAEEEPSGEASSYRTNFT